MHTTSTDIDNQIEALTSNLAEGIDKLASSGFLREGIVKQAITSLVWDIYNAMPDQREALIEALSDWEDPIKEAIAKDAEKHPSPAAD